MTQPYKMYRFRCRNGHATHEWTNSTPHSHCPICHKYCQNYGKYTPYS